MHVSYVKCYGFESLIFYDLFFSFVSILCFLILDSFLFCVFFFIFLDILFFQFRYFKIFFFTNSILFQYKHDIKSS